MVALSAIHNESVKRTLPSYGLLLQVSHHHTFTSSPAVEAVPVSGGYFLDCTNDDNFMDTGSLQSPQPSAQPVTDHLVLDLQQLSLLGVGGSAIHVQGSQLGGASASMDTADGSSGAIGAAAADCAFPAATGSGWDLAKASGTGDAAASASGDAGGSQAAGDRGGQSRMHAAARLRSVAAFQSAFPGLQIADIARALGISVTQLKRRWERHLGELAPGLESVAAAPPSNAPPWPSDH